MSPLFMDTVYQPNSPGSLSAEECNSNPASSEREEDGQGLENRGTKRRQTNRDAARKSRKKQTVRADELHEELQNLEQSNSAFQKEIATLNKEIHLYTTALERHKPFCCLRVSGSSSTNHLSVSTSPVDATLPQNGSSPPKNPPQTSSSSSPSPSASVTPSLGHHSVDNAHLSPSPSSGLPAELFTTGSSSSIAASGPFSVTNPQALFSVEPPTLLHTNSLASLPSSFPAPSTRHPGVLDDFLMKQASFLTDPLNEVPPYSGLRPPAAGKRDVAAQGFPMFHPSQFSRYPKNSSLPCNLLPSPRQDPALQSLLVSPQANQSPSPATAFTLKPSYCQQTRPTPLLSLLTVPSPLIVPQTTSSTSDQPLAQPPSSLPHVGDLSGDFSLSEILDIDWILNGTSKP